MGLEYMMHPFFAVLSYLIGAIPFGFLITKLAGQGDIRKTGSGNIGATNVLRAGNKTLALLTLFMDGGKGALATWLFTRGAADPQFCLLIGLAAIIGHCFPIWLKFKGGKGVATALGVFLAATPLAGLAAICVWLATAFVSKTSSLSALTAVLVAPIVTFFVYGQTPAAIAFLITALVWWRHKENIKRLLKGTEPKISFKKAQ